MMARWGLRWRTSSRLPVVKRFRARYVAVLIFLGLLSLLAYFNLSGLIESQASNAAAINIAGRQRMLSQRLDRLVERYSDTLDENARDQIRNELVNVANRMLRSHEALINGDAELGLKPLQSRAVRKLYFGPEGYVDRDIRQFLGSLSDYIDREGRSANIDHHPSNHRHFSDWPEVVRDPLLISLDHVVTLLQEESEDATQTLKKRALLIFAATSFVLILSGIGIFRPIVRKIEDDVFEQAAVQARLQGIIDGALDAIIAINERGEVIEFNPSATNIFGYPKNEALGRDVADLIIPERLRESHRQALERFKRTSIPTVLGRRMELPAIRADGREFVIELAIVKNSRAEGTVFTAFIRDITESRTTELALRRSQKMDAIGKLSGGLAHDFNNILGIISGNLEILQRMIAGNSKALERVETALRSIKRASTLTKRLLRFSRQQPQVHATVSVNQIIQDVRDLLEKSLTNQISLKFNLSDDLWPTELDPGDLEDALVNLAINARDAMPEGGQLIIKTFNMTIGKDFLVGSGTVPMGDFAVVSVADTGAGMSKDIQERIFEPFFTTKPKDKGTGLGLSMVYGFVKRSKGHITVYSEEGIGTQFRLYFNRSTKGADAAVELIEEPEHARGGSETILIVDDERELASVAGTYLEGLGYRVILAESGQTAVDILESTPEIELVLSDVVMPGGINGFELLDIVERRDKLIPFILASGFTDNLEKVRGSHNRLVPILTKPYALSALAGIIRGELDRRKSKTSVMN